MNKTKIPWCDYTWNPITGCSPASAGCAHCYAADIARRFKTGWGQPTFHPERLKEPYSQRKPAKIFVCSMSDLFHPLNTDEQISAVFSTMHAAQQHTFMVLTKRPQRMVEFLTVWNIMLRQLHKGRLTPPMRNVWLGVTAEDQDHFNARWRVLAQLPAAVRFVSIEPMLGPIDVHAMLNVPNPDWIICGPENGRGARPCDPAWISLVAKHCRDGGIPFFDKREPPLRREYPEPLMAMS